MKIKHVVILAGGKGSRLRPYTVVLPKPLMPIGDYSILELIIRQLKKQGISVVIISHRMPDVFAVSDRIAVLRRGKLVANKLAKNSSPEEVTALITGAIETA